MNLRAFGLRTLLPHSGLVRFSGLFCLVLFLAYPVQAERTPASSHLNVDLSMLDLDRTDGRYALASNSHSTGFMPAPIGQKLEDAPHEFKGEQGASLTANFRQHSRYWLSARVINQTETRDWYVHISNFGFQQPRILIRDWEGQTIHTIDNSVTSGATEINAIGRAAKVTLEPGMSYQIVVELSASHVTWKPYIGLMSAEFYQHWQMQMDFAFKLAIGIMLGIILLGFVAWALTSDKTFFWGAASSLVMLCYYLEHSSLPAILGLASYEKTAFFWLLVTFSLLTMTAFAASFLQINRRSGRSYSVFYYTALATMLVGLAGTQLSFNANVLVYSLNYFAVSLGILGSGISRVRSQGRYYWMYILGWLPMVLSMVQVIWVVNAPREAVEEIGVSYKMIHVLYIQILHMVLHIAAIVLRVKALNEEKHRMEQISQAKSRFIAHSSHDLSQPLHSMNVYMESLKPHVHGQAGNDLFVRLKESHRQMSESFSAIMDLTKLESGVIRPGLETVSLERLFSKLKSEYLGLAMSRRLELSVEAESLQVRSDPVLLERLLRNLISNAIKYTDAGKVRVVCRSVDDQVVIEVIDTGCGIASEHQEAIFDIYHRSLDAPDTTSGSGIGLSIVRHISQLLDHPVSLTSVPGEGSCFAIQAPLAEVPAQSRNPETPSTKSSKFVVALVLGNTGLRDPVWDRLKQWNCSVLIFNSADEVLQSRLPVDIVMCDDANHRDIALLSDRADVLTQDCVTACICKPGFTLPEHWVALSAPVMPAQLRALLNFAARKRQSQAPTAVAAQ